MERSYIYNKKEASKKNPDLLYCTKQLLMVESLKIIYFSYIQSCLNYAIVWASILY